MNGHIINCDEGEFFNSFLPGAYLGVGIVIKGTNPEQLSRTCKTTYSMYADMKTVRADDIVFVHAGQKIYGGFKAASEFCEDPTITSVFLSKNVHYHPDPNYPGSGWKANITSIPSIGYYRRIAITHFCDRKGGNLCFEEGFDSNEVFELKLKKRIWSIPERWLYTDASRTIRPLMEDEAWELVKILERENSDNANRQNLNPANLGSFIPIEFILNPNIVIDEKIIEGWILENIGRNQILDAALGPFTSFGNNMPAGYLKFMDIFGFQEMSTGIRKYKVIEVKKENSIFPEDINQLIGYTDWVIENIAAGDYKTVEGIIIAKGFDNDCVNFVKNFNTTGRKIRLVKFAYSDPSYNQLEITRVV
ncbi:MAG: hypothetical protein HY882_04925 [Deltaproteobacteria bacterium]|nr:hypothetical protein [Deltaproteobacteria bacterium]